MPIISLSSEAASANLKRERLSHWPDGRRDGSRLSGVVSVDLTPSFGFSLGEPMFAMGSCFARNVERRLHELGFNIVSWGLELTEEEAEGRDRHGILNKYTAHSMLNELRWALEPGAAYPQAAFLEVQEGTWFDPQLPGVSLTGSLEMVTARRRKIAELYRLIPRCRVVILTLGLVEAWFDTRTGLYLNGAPPGAAQRREPDRFRLDVLTVQETREALEAIHALLRRGGHPDFRILITVSPVPMKASFTGKDAISANTYSKSALRAAAEEFVAAHDNVDYFPSYEIATLTNRESAYAEDNIHVAPELVDAIMDSVVAKYAPGLFEPPETLGDDEGDVAALRSRIAQYLEAGDFTKTAKTLHVLAKTDQWRLSGFEEFEFRFEYGRSMLELGKTAIAETQLAQAVSLEPRSAPALFYLGVARQRLGRPHEAETFLRRAVDADPGRSAYRLRLAKSLFQLKRYSEADRQLAWLLESSPGDGPAVKLQHKCREALAGAMTEQLREGL